MRKKVGELRRFARNYFELAVVENGKTRREHLEAVEKVSGKTPAPLNVSIPEDAIYLWNWFCQIVDLGGGINLSTLDQWSRLFNIKPLESEILILRDLEEIRLKVRDNRNRLADDEGRI